MLNLCLLNLLVGTIVANAAKVLTLMVATSKHVLDEQHYSEYR